MNIDLPAGKYVVAVSGGVDSVALLHLLCQLQRQDVIPSGVEESSAKGREDLSTTLRYAQDDGKYKFVVAHFDHGIREDSAKDRQHVQQLAKKYGLPFVYHRGELGPGASEAAAREARYAFLHQVREASGAQAIITAHHQDDVLETVILNLLRGTGRKGLSSLKSTDIVRRPMLHVPKSALQAYAADQGLVWHEDSTNVDQSYLRNYIRANILTRFDKKSRGLLLQIAQNTAALNHAIDTQLTNYLHLQPARHKLRRHDFILLPHAVAREVLAAWLRANTGAEISKKTLERLVVAAKTGRNGSRVDIDTQYWLKISPTLLALAPRER